MGAMPTAGSGGAPGRGAEDKCPAISVSGRGSASSPCGSSISTDWSTGDTSGVYRGRVHRRP